MILASLFRSNSTCIISINLVYYDYGVIFELKIMVAIGL